MGRTRTKIPIGTTQTWALCTCIYIILLTSKIIKNFFTLILAVSLLTLFLSTLVIEWQEQLLPEFLTLWNSKIRNQKKWYTIKAYSLISIQVNQDAGLTKVHVCLQVQWDLPDCEKQLIRIC